MDRAHMCQCRGAQKLGYAEVECIGRHMRHCCVEQIWSREGHSKSGASVSELRGQVRMNCWTTEQYHFPPCYVPMCSVPSVVHHFTAFRLPFYLHLICSLVLAHLSACQAGAEAAGYTAPSHSSRPQSCQRRSGRRASAKAQSQCWPRMVARSRLGAAAFAAGA